MAKTKHQIRSEETYNKFMKTLIEMLNEEDIDKITIREICSRVGLSPRSFYLYFPSKEAAILKCYIYSNNNQLFQDTSLPSDPYERLLMIFLKHHQLALEAPKLARAIYICKLTTYDEQLYSDSVPIYKLVEEAVLQCQRDHIIKKDLIARDVTWDLITFSRGIQMDYFSRGESYDLLDVGMEKLKRYLTIFTV